MTNHRQQTRLPFPAESMLMVPALGQQYHTQVLDISLKGALLAAPHGGALADAAAQAGTPCRLTLRLPEADLTLEMEMEVVYCSGGRMGLHTTEIDLDSLSHLRRILELNLGDPNLLQREWREPSAE